MPTDESLMVFHYDKGFSDFILNLRSSGTNAKSFQRDIVVRECSQENMIDAHRSVYSVNLINQLKKDYNNQH
jgi:hypothetical protein